MFLALAMVSSRPMPAACQHCGAQLAVGAMACFRCGRMVARADDASGTGAGSAVVSPTQLGTAARLDLLENQWRLVKQLGQGSVGEVWQAHDVTLDRSVAVKLMHPAVAKDPGQVARFEREARVLAGLDHPNLLPVLGIGRHGDRPFLVTRLLEGKTLAEVIHQRGGKLGAADCARILAPVCDALACLHAAQIVHRDLKPSNVFVGDDRRVTLMDLGSALEPGSELTQLGQLLGTLGYLSPEQVGGRPLDGSSDVYGVGCLLYEALTGKPPFPGEPQQQLLHHLNSPRPDAALEGAPAALAQLAQRAMALEATQRPTALALKLELEKSLPAEEPTSPFSLPLAPTVAPPQEPRTQQVVFTPTTGNAAYPDERPPRASAPAPAAARESVSLAGSKLSLPGDGPTVPRAVPLSVLIHGGQPRASAPRAPVLGLEAMPREFPTRRDDPARPALKPLSARAKAGLASAAMLIISVVAGLLFRAPPPLPEPVRVDQPAVLAPIKKDEAKAAETRASEPGKATSPSAVAMPMLIDKKETFAAVERPGPDSRSRRPNKSPPGFGKLRVTTTIDGIVVPVLLYVERKGASGHLAYELQGMTPIELTLSERDRTIRVQYEEDPPILVPLVGMPKKNWPKAGAPLDIMLREQQSPGVGLGESTAAATKGMMSARAISPMPAQGKGGRK